MAVKQNKNDVNHVLEKAGLTAVTTGLVASQIFPDASYVLPEMLSSESLSSIPLPIVAGGIGALNSALCDGLHLTLNKGIPLPKKAQEYTTFAMSVGTSALTMYLLLRMGNINVGLVNSALIGSIGEVVGGAGFYYLKENKFL